MSELRNGIRVPLSPARRLVTEFLHHAKKVPTVPVSMRLNVARLADARSACSARPSWVGLFMKAYGLVAQEQSELRRCYVPWPRAHLYEHPVSECSVLVEREWAGEKAVLAAKIRNPAMQPLPTVAARLHRMQNCPLEEMSDLRQLIRIARWPWFVRRWVFWSTLNLSGQSRSRRFGTFMVSTLGDVGAELIHPLMPLTTYLSFGPIDAKGDVTVTLIFDHRVLDGRAAARALSALEEALEGPVRAEVVELADLHDELTEPTPTRRKRQLDPR